MKKLFLRCVALVLVCISLLPLIGCGANQVDDSVTTIRFWATGTEERLAAYQKLTDQFNQEYEGQIKVVFTPRPVSGYETSLQNVLSFSSAPDVFVFDDRYLKKWAAMDLLAPLDEMVEETQFDTSDIWDNLITRFRYDAKNSISNETAPLYAMPCGNIPTVVFYNKDVLEQMGIRVISKDYSDDLPEEEKHGFYHSGTQGQMPQASETLVFNDRIAMTWEELVDLSMYLNKSYNPQAPTDYGFYCHWWFCFGWSVGGDAIKYDKSTKQWTFALGDKTHKVNEEGVELPSMYETMEFYLSLIQKRNYGGMGLMPSQSEVDTLGNQVYFLSQKVALLTDTADMISIFKTKSSFEWDIAPLPVHKDGVQAASSQAQGIGVWNKSQNKDAAVTFASYMASPEAQEILSDSGLVVPNQREVAYKRYDGVDGVVGNEKLLAETCEYSRPGDWTYMSDDAWINEWAPLLNNSVRNSSMSLDEFLETVTDRTNVALQRGVN